MGQALYRKYRTRSLKETIGQEHITDTLEHALEQGRISHAYLFTGPRGVGKTSVARILAHEINKLPYDDDSSHMDIIEIDAASNRRIDEIRELRDKVYVAPTSAAYKVYIIDEVHMLTREAFNALLKILEEPPAHVVFILATTDAHKLPDTIVSRTQRFTFKPVETERVAARLSDIAKQEKIKISPEALRLLAEHGEGSFRDSISLLDQLSSESKQVEAADVQKLLGIPPRDAIAGLLESLGNGQEARVIMKALNDLLIAGYQPAGIAKEAGRLLRQQLVDDKIKLPPAAALNLMSQLIEVPASHNPERFLEIALLNARQGAAKPAAVAVEPAPDTVMPDTAPEQAPPDDSAEDIPPPSAPEQPAAAQQPGTATFDETVWPDVLQTLKKSHNTLYGVVRMAQPAFGPDDTLQLAFAFAFHEKRLKEPANRQKLADVLYGLTGKAVKVECVLDTSARPPKVTLEVEKTPAGTDLHAISSIFGEAELLES